MSRKPPSLVPPLARDVTAEVAVTLTLGEHWPTNGLGSPTDLLDQLPDPSTLPPGSWIAVLAAGPEAPRGLGRLLRRPGPHAHLAVRCTALLLRGYADTCGDGEGTAFGRCPEDCASATLGA